jgi:hypothetical protein
VSRGGAIVASLLATIGRPDWWLLALAGFLVRGGFFVFLLPIVLLPSPLVISNLVAPLIVPIALGRIGFDAVAVALGAFAVLAGWLVVGGWLGAAADLALIREQVAAAVDEGVGSTAGNASADGHRPAAAISRPNRTVVGGFLMARLVAWVPLAIAIAVGTARIVAITYAQLTRPFEVALPLVLRVALEAAPDLAVIALTWVMGEVVGGLAGRRIVLDSAPTGRALLAAVGDLVRRPGSTLVPWLVATGLFLVILGGTVGAASIAWSGLIVALSSRAVDLPTVALNLLVFVAIWLAALVVAGFLAAVRASLQTFEEVRRRSATRTFGVYTHHRPGDWSVPGEGGSL